jgi:hypothetical protein
VLPSTENAVIPSLRRIQPATNGATDEAFVSSRSRSLFLGVVAHSLKAGLGALFLYLGTTKLLGRDEAARLAAIGVDRYLRDTIGWLELTVAALLLARPSSSGASESSFPLNHGLNVC